APSIDIGIHFPALPSLTLVPGTPVYYAPSVDTNFFFYDGMYWVFKDDTWYASSWYNGPWAVVEPDIVPDFILRVPVRYYRHPLPAVLFPRGGGERAAGVGRALGQELGSEACGLGAGGARADSPRGARADLPAPVLREALSDTSAAGGAPQPALQVPASRGGGAAALPAACGAAAARPRTRRRGTPLTLASDPRFLEATALPRQC